MWLDEQNLAEPGIDRDGKRWHLRVCHDVVALTHVARVFF